MFVDITREPLTSEEIKEQIESEKFLSKVRAEALRNKALVEYLHLMGDTANWKSKGYYICWQLIGSKNYELLEFILNHSIQNGCEWGIDVYGENEPILGSLLKESLKRRDLKAFGLIFDMERKGQKGFSIGIKDFTSEEEYEQKSENTGIYEILKLALEKGIQITEEELLFIISGGHSFNICQTLLESFQSRSILTTELIEKLKLSADSNINHRTKIKELLARFKFSGCIGSFKQSEYRIVPKPYLSRNALRDAMRKRGFRMADLQFGIENLMLDESDNFLLLVIVHSKQNGCEWGFDLIEYMRGARKNILELSIKYGNFIAFRLLSALGLFDKVESTTRILEAAIKSKSGLEENRQAIYKKVLSSLKGKYTVDKKMMAMIIGSGNEVFFKTLLENSPDIFDKQRLHNLLANKKMIPNNCWMKPVIEKRLKELEDNKS